MPCGDRKRSQAEQLSPSDPVFDANLRQRPTYRIVLWFVHRSQVQVGQKKEIGKETGSC